MEEQNNRASRTDRSKLIAAFAIVLLGGSIGWHVLRNISEQHDLDSIRAEQAKNKGMQEVLNQAQHDLAMAHARTSAIEAEAHEQETERIAAERRVDESQQRIRSLEGAQASAAKWKKELEAAKASETAAQQRLTEMRAQLDQTLAENFTLVQSNSSLKDEMDRLAANKAFMDASMTQAFRGKKERLTVIARKARKLQVSMVLPASAAKDASYILTAPDGEVIHGDSPGMSIITHPAPGERTAALGKGVDMNNGEQVKLVYIPKKKLKPGMYKVEVRSGDRSVGSTFLNLR